ncbi:MAG: hypothetical protein KGN79_13870, partial [Acidobacteriota bacterium]|nr:hypothetical protein [Acidobacteriota bacterium]
SALAHLRRREFLAVVIDETLSDCESAAANAIWEKAGLAIPLQLNFALSGTSRLVREIRAALTRRDREQHMARQAATEEMETEIKNMLAGVLLHSQLALKGTEVPPPVAERLRLVADLAGSLRQKLDAPARARVESAA